MFRLVLGVLLQSLTLLCLGPSCEASSLGLVVHVVPLDSDGGKTVRAHFSVIAANPCPDLSGLCAAGEDCETHPVSKPFEGSLPSLGWCVRQWQKTVPSTYTANVTLGSSVSFYVSVKAAPKIRENNGRLNQPPYVALPPPLRARVNCRHHIHLSVKDLDGDKVSCRFARADQGECLNCSLFSFIELDETHCILAFTGDASKGEYPLVLMVEDRIPAPKWSHLKDQQPLSSVPVHLTLTVEEASSSCSAEPIAIGQTPKEDATLYVLPYQQVDLTARFISEQESVLEIAVVGPPELFRSALKSSALLSGMAMAWVRSPNTLAPLLPICFAANTNSSQSEPRCVWLYQRQMTGLPAGTELKCENMEMTLVLPVATLKNINLKELQLNSPTCPVNYNSTHLTARISLTGCGTKIVQSGSELVYTNTLQSVRHSVVSRLPSLILPLACRIPGVQAKGPRYQINMPAPEETFGGPLRVWLEFHFPGDGPLGKDTKYPKFRHLHSLPADGRLRREASSALNFPRSGLGSKINTLDLHVMSNCSIDRAEMMVGNCMESESENMENANPILEGGCTAAAGTLEVITSDKGAKVYRLDMGNMKAKGTTMFVECTVFLCIAPLPSQECPDPCTRTTRASHNTKGMVNGVYSHTYKVQSGPISLVVTTAPPATTKVSTTAHTAPTVVAPITTTTTPPAAATTTAAPTAVTTAAPTTSHAPEDSSAMTVGLICSSITIILQKILLY